MGKDRKFWKFLWALSIPPKVKSFLWRACLGILPTFEMLHLRHMRDNGLCPGCTLASESMAHSLWTCPVANDVWVESGLKLQKWDRFILNFCNLMETVWNRFSHEDVKLFSCVAYFIWRQRNSMVHEGNACNPTAVV